MRLAILPPGEARGGAATAGRSRWATLPGLCCQASGGQELLAASVTTVWLLFYIAADLMDKVQDDDPPAAWWAEGGRGMALSAASGLYFSASALLNELHRDPQTAAAAYDLAERFYRSFLMMCSGQQRELAYPPNSLDDFWAVAEAKSGAFFALGCWAGARLATDEEQTLNSYQTFGRLLGVLVQIADELEEVRTPDEGRAAGQHPGFGRSLPVIYAREVLPEGERTRLETLLQAAPGDPAAAGEAVALVDRAGAADYLALEMLRRRRAASEALQAASPQPEAGAQLRDLLASI